MANHTTIGRIYHVSREGLRALRQQLEVFQREYAELRSKLAELRQIKDAEDFDLVEDTMRLDFLDKEIARVKQVLARCRVLKKSRGGRATVRLGSKVRLQQDGREIECMVVSALEADPSEGKISDESPLGRALLGKMIHALVEVVAPRARLSYRIVDIES